MLYNGGKILTGLFIFLVLLAFPFWYDNLISAKPSVKPDPKLPVAEKQCVASAAYMRDAHMRLLNSWRNDVVRSNQRLFTMPDHRKFHKSLTGTCLQCHANKAEFCDRCHGFVAVSEPYCFSCHVDPAKKTNGAGSRLQARAGIIREEAEQ